MSRVLGLLAVIAVGVAGGVVGYNTWTSDPNEIRLTINLSSPTVVSNETVTLTVEIENVTLDSVSVDAVGLEQSLLNGAVVEQMVLVIGGQETLQPQGNYTHYTLNQTLDGGAKLTIRYTLRATQPGTYEGAAKAWVDSELALGVTRSKARSESLQIQVQ